MRFLECCCTSASEALEAYLGGAGRIELCSRLDVGGVTPSEALLKEVLAATPLPVNVLVRPREGDFCYSEAEALQMLGSIEACKRLGANGIVIGALTPAGDVDMPLMKRLIAASRPLPVTFHRAFDVCRDPLEAFADVQALGCERLLSSGHEPSAYEGRFLLRKLVDLSKGIIVMPGAGINPSNIAALEADTGAGEYHGSAHGKSGHTEQETVAAIVNH